MKRRDVRLWQIRYQGTEWAQRESGRWTMVGHPDCEVFRGPRGWAAIVRGEFVDYFPSRSAAMDAVLAWLRREAGPAPGAGPAAAAAPRSEETPW